MARYDYHSSSAGPIDTSGIKNLGAIAQNAMDLVFQQQQDDQRMNLMRQEAATQARQRQQQLDQQQASEQHQMAVDRQNKIMQLAQLSKNGKTFESMARYLYPDIDPTELQFGVAFADETSRVAKEQQDKADKAKQEQINRQLLLQGGGLQALAGMDPNARVTEPMTSFRAPAPGELAGLGMRPAPPPIPQISQVARAAGLAGVDPGVLGGLVSGERSRQAQKRDDEEAKWQRDNAAKNARANTRAAATAGALNLNQQEVAADRLRRRWATEVGKFDEGMTLSEGAMAGQERAKSSGDQASQRLADASLLRAYARMLQPTGPMTDQDITGVIGNLPGVAGSAQTIDRVMRGSGVLGTAERDYIMAATKRRMASVGEKRRNVGKYVEKRAKAIGLDPSDIMGPPSFGGAVGGSSTSASPDAFVAPTEDQYERGRKAFGLLNGRAPTDEELVSFLRAHQGR